MRSARRFAFRSPRMTHPRHPIRAAWHRAADAYGRFLNGLLMLSVAILVFPVTLQIVSRWTDLLPHYIWTEEMARFLFIWMIMIGAMVGVREGTHFEVDLFPVMSPKVGRRVAAWSARSPS